jgi:hypothetical protein
VAPDQNCGMIGAGAPLGAVAISAAKLTIRVLVP